MRLEREVIVNFENHSVDSHVCQLSQALAQRFQIFVALVVNKVNGAPWLRAPWLEWFEPTPGLGGPRRIDRQKQDEVRHSSPRHINHSVVSRWSRFCPCDSSSPATRPLPYACQRKLNGRDIP